MNPVVHAVHYMVKCLSYLSWQVQFSCKQSVYLFNCFSILSKMFFHLSPVEQNTALLQPVHSECAYVTEAKTTAVTEVYGIAYFKHN